MWVIEVVSLVLGMIGKPLSLLVIPCGFYLVDLFGQLSFSFAIVASPLLPSCSTFECCGSDLSKDEPIMSELLQGALSVPVYLRYRRSGSNKHV